MATDALSFEMLSGPPSVITGLLGLRPRALREWEPWSRLEDGVFRPLLSSLIGGSSARMRRSTRAGAWERYAVQELRPAHGVRASLDGLDLGIVARPHVPARFGFSEFPSRPCSVRVTSFFLRPVGARPLQGFGKR